MRKRMTFWFIGVLLVMGGAALYAQAEADFNTEAEGNGVVISGYKGKGGDVVIPATIGGKAVVGIGKEAFVKSGVTSVTIPEGVISIGAGAFAVCAGLTSVTIPGSVTGIGRSAFYGCSLKPEISADIEKRFGKSVFE